MTTDLLKKAAEHVAARVPRALFVGGYVRDALLGVEAHDADLEVFGVTPETLEALLEELFPGRVNVVGRAFGIFKVTIEDGRDLDVAIPRRESKTGAGHKGFAVSGDPSMTIEEAARRRDFTIGAIYQDVQTGEIVDPFGGRKDLENRTLRVVDQQTFVDDPLRVYRGVQFAARLGLTVDPATFDLMREMVANGALDELSKERVTEELRKLFVKAERPSVGFALLRELGVIARDYPELQILSATPQEAEWHPEGDVWIHTLMVIDQAAAIARREQSTEPETLRIVLGALCHDLGKPSTTKMGEKDGVPRIRSLGHEEAGEAPTRSLLARWTFGDDVERVAVASAREHLKPGMLYLQLEKGTIDADGYANAVRKMIKRIHPVPWKVLLAIAEADFRGRGVEGADRGPYVMGDRFIQTVREHRLDEAPTKPLIQGQDLAERGVAPGPRMGELIREIERARDQGEIKTREEALARLDQLL